MVIVKVHVKLLASLHVRVTARYVTGIASSLRLFLWLFLNADLLSVLKRTVYKPTSRFGFRVVTCFRHHCSTATSPITHKRYNFVANFLDIKF